MIIQRSFTPETRSTVRAEIVALGYAIQETHEIDLDPTLQTQNIDYPTNCFFVVETEPPAPEPSQEDLLAELDQRILDLEFENILLKEGLL